ncbi:MAG: hypothetical protein Q4A13_10830 [Fretibacterium sp.]|nr:hypothetical protein [Fretibacterium sp.]
MATKVRNVRLDDALDDKILAIAAAEERSISNTIQRLLREAADRYLEAHPELKG